jgi:hypothetical protein
VFVAPLAEAVVLVVDGGVGGDRGGGLVAAQARYQAEPVVDGV